MMTKIKKYILLLALAIAAGKGYAQTSSASPAILQTLDMMYKNYDSVPYMSFDVVFFYNSDTLNGNFMSEQLNGTYTMAGKKAKYSLGDIDFMQNDSFFVAVYNKDKIILVDEPKMKNSGSQLPMRQQIDSLLKGYANKYTITDGLISADTGLISLLALDSTAQFSRFNLRYDSNTKMLYQLYYEYREADEYDPASPTYTAPVMRKKRLTIQFSNYRFDNYLDELYSESNYIFFEKGVCKPSQKYDGFKIYNSRPITTNLPVAN